MSTEAPNLQLQFQKKCLLFSIWRSCLNCNHWRPNARGAGPTTPQDCAKFNIVPPLEVIVIGCLEWLPHIPF